MPAFDFTGYTAAPGALFNWDLEVVSIKRPATTGRVFTAIATNLKCKADGEEQGLKITQAGAFPAYQRKFFFACFYIKIIANVRTVVDVRTYLKLHDTLVDADGVEWQVESIANPGGADEHLQVLGHRAPLE
jgi:hypothetical protein